jgi:hypothetical protein
MAGPMDKLRDYLEANPEEMKHQIELQKIATDQVKRICAVLDEQIDMTRNSMDGAPTPMTNFALMHNAHVTLAAVIRHAIFRMTGEFASPVGVELFCMQVAHQAYDDAEQVAKQRGESTIQ